MKKKSQITTRKTERTAPQMSLETHTWVLWKGRNFQNSVGSLKYERRHTFMYWLYSCFDILSMQVLRFMKICFKVYSEKNI